jgi:hypothetical protein
MFLKKKGILLMLVFLFVREPWSPAVAANDISSAPVAYRDQR